MDDLTSTIFFYRTGHPFSNFHPSIFTVNGLVFLWAEQYIMCRKAIYFHDQETASLILHATSPGVCKGLGRKVKQYDDDTWASVREQVAFEACLHKFEHNKKLRAVLLGTGTALLVEAAPTDRIWGIGFTEEDAPAYKHQWGMNLLGQTLMRVRDELGSRRTL